MLIEAIDAVASDLQAQAGRLGLPAFSTQKYARPLLENVETLTKPLLAVFPWGRDPFALSTDGTYEDPDVITIGWFYAIPGSMETGLVDPDRAKAALEQTEAIVAQLQSYYNGIPGLVDTVQHDTAITRVRYGKVRGDVYACEISLKVTSWS